VASLRVQQILVDAFAASGSTGGTVVDTLCAASVEALPVGGAGLALMTATGHGGTVAATDGPAMVMENLQYTLGEGPCMDAFRDGRPVLHSDLASTGMSRWPGFVPAALEAEIAAMFAFPLQVGAGQ
jgi:hypothetical protein